MDFDKIINADALPKNGIIVIKAPVITQDLVKELQELGEKLKPAVAGKNISVFLLNEGESIETKSPEDMAKYGWYKKNKGDICVKIEDGQFLRSLIGEIKGGSPSARKDLVDMLADLVEEEINKL
jgi:hypothetical protein